METVVVIGAAGRIGTRILTQLKDAPEYRVLPVESGSGLERLRERGWNPTPLEDAVKEGTIFVLAVPDNRIGSVAADLVPRVRPGSLIVCLDPAAPHAGKLPQRREVSYFVTHPSHPLLFQDDPDPEARKDHWGWGKAPQCLVNTLVQGPESDYARGEALARRCFGPILRSHRVTLEQMAMLEPALTETVAFTCLTVIRQAMDEVVRRGVPAQAVRDFLLGHLRVELAILFGEIEWIPSDAAQQAIREAMDQLFRADWKKVFEPEEVLQSVRRIATES